MFRIFKEFVSHLDSYQGDPHALILNVIGGLLVAFTFFSIGTVCAVLANKGSQGKNRHRITTMFGLFLISCSLSRLISVLCIFHNYAILDGWIKILTGILALLTIVYLPRTIKEMLEERALSETLNMLKKTKEDLNKVQELSEKMDNK